jgi:hypothetical protein
MDFLKKHALPIAFSTLGAASLVYALCNSATSTQEKPAKKQLKAFLLKFKITKRISTV